MSDLAITLRAVPFEERHRIVTAITEHHGIISAMAHNAIQSRRFGGTLDLFAASHWQFTKKVGSDLVRLEGAEIKRSFDKIRHDFDKLTTASLMNEILLKIAHPNEPVSDLFRLHSNALAEIEEMPNTENLTAVLNTYLVKLLQWSGHQPQALNCLNCSKSIREWTESPEDVVLACVEQAGWVCPNCKLGQNLFSRSFPLTGRAWSDLLISMSQPTRKAAREATAPSSEQKRATAYLLNLLSFHLPGIELRDLKSLAFLGVEV